MADEIFDDDVEEKTVVSKDWTKTQKDLTEGGYREGLVAGKESQLQTGFNQGFIDGAQTLYLLAKKRGNISAKLSLGNENEDNAKLEDLQKELTEIRKVESNLINASKNTSVQDMKNLKVQES